MAKRIEFIAPVEAMRGNLSGRQDLLYAENDNKAYYGPVGSVNYARNYTTRFIGAKRASDGRKYFSVKTKTANHLTPAAKYAMALLGGTGAIVASIMRNKTMTPYVEAYAQWIELQNLGSTSTFRETLTAWVRQGLATKSATIAFAGPRSVYRFINPWISMGEYGQTPGAEISNATIWKFAEELGPSNIALIEITYTGAAGTNLKVQKYVATDETFAAQFTQGGKMYNSLMNLGMVDGLLGAASFQVPANQQVKLGVGTTTLLQTVPVWSVVDTEETAVQSSDEPTTDLRYVAHAE